MLLALLQNINLVPREGFLKIYMENIIQKYIVDYTPSVITNQGNACNDLKSLGVF